LHPKASHHRLQEITRDKSFCWIARRRGLLSVLLGLVAFAYALWSEAGPMDLLGPDASPYWFLPWSLAFAGAGVRIWGAGNLAKNKEVTRTGIYCMVRHPLYLGNCLVFLAFLITLDRLVVGSLLFLGLLFVLHYPPMLQEEARLAREYPQQFEAMQGTPRLLPNLLRLRQALATDRFSIERVHRNYGLRGLWGPILLPIAAEALILLRSSL
jgi:protein-S-isoprenylcysteine O-methyltransferase Ste14